MEENPGERKKRKRERGGKGRRKLGRESGTMRRGDSNGVGVSIDQGPENCAKSRERASMSQRQTRERASTSASINIDHQERD